MKALLSWLNEQHWYIIATIVIAVAIFWTYGCESQVTSMLDPNQKVNRMGLQNELNYLVGQVEVKVADLDKQDEIKQALLDAANVIGTTGSINPSGLINLAACIGAIGFGLNRNQKLKSLTTDKTP